MSKYPKQSWKNHLIFVLSPVNGVGLFILYYFALLATT
jgi:hypothetical protein